MEEDVAGDQGKGIAHKRGKHGLLQRKAEEDKMSVVHIKHKT